MDSIFSPTVPPLERFDRYFDFVYQNLTKVRERCGAILGCPYVSVGSEVSTQDQVVREAIDRIMDRKLQFFVSAVRDAAAQGLIETADPVAKAQALFSSYQGTIAQARIQNDIELIRDYKHVAREVLGVKRAEAVAT
jgi:TetR/AcrR family transcriptional repressor of nem operon